MKTYKKKVKINDLTIYFDYSEESGIGISKMGKGFANFIVIPAECKEHLIKFLQDIK